MHHESVHQAPALRTEAEPACEDRAHPGGLARLITARSHSKPCTSILAHKSGGKRIERCTSFSDSGFGGRPRGFGSVLMGRKCKAFSVMQKSLAQPYLL